MKIKLSRRQEILVDFLLLAIIAAGLIRPYVKAKYLDKWASIESTFVSDARFLEQHWPHPQWQPLWYGGTRFDYIYPPALRYGTAIIAKIFGYLPVKAYHIYTGIFYCMGIAGVYLLVRVATKSRVTGWLCALAAALMSPSFLFMTNLRNDAWKLLPLRLGVLSKYGEGPHMTAFAWMPVMLAFAWIAFDRRKLWAIALAAISAAAVVSNNFYGATALATFYPLLVWAFWITRRDKRMLPIAAVIPCLTYGLTAFWLVPSYLRVTTENMKYVSEHGTTWSIWIAVVVAVAFAAASDRFAKGKETRTWAVFTTGCVVFFSLNVLGNYYFNFRVMGEPGRLAPELDLVLILGAATLFHWLWRTGKLPAQIVVGLLVLASFYTTKGYIRNAWNMFALAGDYQSRVEYQVDDWLAKNMPGSRSFATGSVRFWYDAWHDLAQVGGGSEQGLLNDRVEVAQWEITQGGNIEPTLLWLQDLGVDAAYVDDQRSQEIYHDYGHPEKFAGAAPLLYDDHKGNFIYGIPRRYKPLARVVETAKINACKPPAFNDDVANLHAYHDVIENGPDAPPQMAWHGTDAFTVSAKVDAGQSVLVQETYDPAWRATAGGKELPIRKDAMNFMLVEAPAGDGPVEFQFVTPLENVLGRWTTGFTVLLIVGLFVMGARERRA
jgi:hypothetical protein